MTTSTLSTPSISSEAARRAIGLIFLINGVLYATWGVNIPGVRDHLHLNATQIGWALLAVGVGSLCSMPLTGHWIARWGSHRMTRVLSVLAMLSLLPPFLAPNLTTLILALAVMGAMNGALDVSMNAQGVTIEKALKRPIMSRLHAFFSLGGVIGALLGTQLIGKVPMQMHVLLVTVALVLIAALAGRSLIPDGHAAQSDDSSPEAARPGVSFTVLVLLLGSMCALGMLAEGANYDWATLYYRDILQVAGGTAGIGYTAFVVAMTLGRWFGDRVRTRLGDQTTVLGGSALTAAGMALALLVPEFWVATLGFTLAGLGLSNVVPVMYGTAGHALHGKGIAQVATLGYGGFLLGPPIIGFVADHAGLRSALGIALVSAALVALLGTRAFQLVRSHQN